MGPSTHRSLKPRCTQHACAEVDSLQGSRKDDHSQSFDDRIDTFPLLKLPVDILRRILQNVDVCALAALSQCNKYFRREISDESLWLYLAMTRFRVTLRTATSRRLQVAGAVSWRTLYSNWHTQARIPVTRYSGPNIHPFAKGRACGVFAWFTVTSTEDCRLVNGNLRFRLVVQNVCCSKVAVLMTAIAFRVDTVGTISVLNPSRDGPSAAIRSAIVDSAPNNRSHLDSLLQNDVTVIFGTIRMPGCIWEVDMLERISAVVVPVVADGEHFDIICYVGDRFWDSYELLPGGWWARVG